jgi:hypothetical protein
MEKEKKKKEIDKIIKKEITKENRKAQKRNQVERIEEKRKEKLSNVTSLTFATSEPEVKEKKKKKVVEVSLQLPSTLEQADQILTEEKLNSFIEHSKKFYPKEENLQINEVAEKIQYLYQNIRVKNEFRFTLFLLNFRLQ